LPADSIRPAPEVESSLNADCIVGLGSVGDRMLILLDIGKLMAAADMGLGSDAD
jgi:purine-binding chemotaxis protein CheW